MVCAKFLAMNRENLCFEDKLLEKLVLALFLLLQLWLFSASFHKFFNNDSLFYMVNAPRSWHDFQHFLLTPDPGKQYRPLTLGFAGLIRPYLGLDPHPYHWIPLIFHLLNTVLFFCVARKLLSGSLAVLFATGFWGFHSVAGWVTYDITYVPDFLHAFLLLLSLMLALRAREKHSPLFYIASLVAFALSLFTKEVAVTFPLGIWLGIGIAEARAAGDAGGASGLWKALKKTLPFVSPYWAIAFIFGCRILYWLNHGVIYTQGAGQSYDFGLLSNLAAKTKYIFWALNLPDVLQIPHAHRYRLLALGLMGCLLAIWCLDLLRRKMKLSSAECGGLVWFVGLSVPALLLSHRLAKWYLYVPLLGLALALGVLAESLGNLLPKSGRRIAALLLLAVLITPVVFSSRVQTRSYIVSSDCAFQSDVVQMYLAEFRAAFPAIPHGAVAFLLPSYDQGAANTIAAPPNDNDRLLNLFYPGSDLRMSFAHKGDRLPDDWRSRPGILMLQWLNGRFCNVTQYYRSKEVKPGRVLIPLIDLSRTDISRSEYYPDYEHFDTPNGRPAFFLTPEKDTLIQIAGSSVAVPLGTISAGARLKFEVSWMFDQGDGGWAEVDLKTAKGVNTLFREYMQPNPQKQCPGWKEVQLDLAPYAQPDAELVLKCYNDPGKKGMADWLNWRDLVIVEAAR